MISEHCVQLTNKEGNMEHSKIADIYHNIYYAVPGVSISAHSLHLSYLIIGVRHITSDCAHKACN